VTEVIINLDELSLTLVFLLEDDLTLKFSDEVKLEKWRRGLERQIVVLLAPDGNASSSIDDDHFTSEISGIGRTFESRGSNRIRGSEGGFDNEGPNSSKMEEGILSLLGTRVRHFGHALTRQLDIPIESTGSSVSYKFRKDQARSVTIRSPSDEKDDLTNRCTSSAREQNITPGQLAKRARLAAWLQLSGTGTRKSSFVRRTPAFSGRTATKVKSDDNDEEHGSDSEVCVPDVKGVRRMRLFGGLEKGRSNSTSVFGDEESERRNKSFMISVGTQTEETEISQTSRDRSFCLSSGSESDLAGNGKRSKEWNPEREKGRNSTTDNMEIFIGDDCGDDEKEIDGFGGMTIKKQQSYSTADEMDEDIAQQYAAMFNSDRNSRINSMGAATEHLEKSGSFHAKKGIRSHADPMSNHECIRPGDVSLHFKRNANSNSFQNEENISKQGQKKHLQYYSSHNSLNSPTGSNINFSPISPPASISSLPSSPLSPLMLPVEVIEFEELSLGRLLGSGSEGAVHAAWYRETPVAVKSFNRMEDSVHEVSKILLQVCELCIFAQFCCFHTHNYLSIFMYIVPTRYIIIML